MAIESPKYHVIKKDGNIELREYDTYITASVEIKSNSYNSAANKAFRILADYIFGNNISSTKISMTTPVSEKIAMTAPVIASIRDDQTYEVAFTMPSSYTLKTLPKPSNKEITIRQESSHKIATITFSGYTSENKVDKKTRELEVWTKEQELKAKGSVSVLRYDPPWKPGIFRRNEVSLKIL